MTIKPETYRMVLGGDYKHWTRDPRIRGPSLEGYQCYLPYSQLCLARGRYMHTEDVIYSRQRYSLTSLKPRVVYCQFCKARLAHTQSKRVSRLFAFDI